MSKAPDGEHVAMVLPAGRHFAVTWSLPTEFAGRTNAMLHRSRAFAEFGGRPVEILTFDDFRDYAEIRSRLSKEGFLSDGTSVLNLWEDLPTMVEGLDVPDVGQDFVDFAPLATWSGPVKELDGPHTRRARYAVDGTLPQVDHFRTDGSLLLSDRHDAQRHGVHGGRSLILCNDEGLPLRNFGSSWGLYRAWLEFLIGDAAAWFVVDNKNTARFMATFRRDSAVVLYVVHESHLMSHADGFASELTPSAQEVFPHLDRFDGVVYLTEHQARTFIGAMRTRVIPSFYRTAGASTRRLIAQASNTRPWYSSGDSESPETRRPLDPGNPSRPLVVRSRGTAGRLRGRLPARRPSGSYQPAGRWRLRAIARAQQADPLRISDRVLLPADEHLRGDGAGARRIHGGGMHSDRLRCPVRSGKPIIDTGVNGFIVEYGNVEKLAECIESFLALPEDEQLTLRVAAMERARDFSDHSIVSRWAEVMREAWERKHRAPVALTVSITSTDYCVRSGGRLGIQVLAQVSSPDTALPETPSFFCAMRARQQQDFFRVEASEAVVTGEGAYRLQFDFDPAVTRSLRPSTVDFTLEARCAGSHATTRMPLHGDPVSLQVYATRHGKMSMVLS